MVLLLRSPLTSDFFFRIRIWWEILDKEAPKTSERSETVIPDGLLLKSTKIRYLVGPEMERSIAYRDLTSLFPSNFFDFSTELDI